MSAHLRQQWRARIQREAGPGGGVIPWRVRYQGPIRLDQPRPVKLDPMAVRDFQDVLYQDEQRKAKAAIEALQAGHARLEPKQRELTGTYGVRVDEDCRLLAYPHIDGAWHVMYLGRHDYDEAARRWANPPDMQRAAANEWKKLDRPVRCRLIEGTDYVGDRSTGPEIGQVNYGVEGSIPAGAEGTVMAWVMGDTVRVFQRGQVKVGDHFLVTFPGVPSPLLLAEDQIELLDPIPRRKTAAGQTRTLYRGLNMGTFTTEEFEREIKRNPSAFLRQHLDTRTLGIHWTWDSDSAYNFATDRDPEGWAHEYGGFDDEDEGGVQVGLMLEAEVDADHILEEGTEEYADYAMSDAILSGDHAEHEVTVRAGGRIRILRAELLAEGEVEWSQVVPISMMVAASKTATFVPAAMGIHWATEKNAPNVAPHDTKNYYDSNFVYHGRHTVTGDGPTYDQWNDDGGWGDYCLDHGFAKLKQLWAEGYATEYHLHDNRENPCLACLDDVGFSGNVVIPEGESKHKPQLAALAAVIVETPTSPLTYDRYRVNTRLSLIEEGDTGVADIEHAKGRMDQAYTKWRAANPGRRRTDSYKDPGRWVPAGYAYFHSGNADPGTLAFVDLQVSGDTVAIAYLAVRPDQRGKGHARKLVEAVYERWPGAEVHWGKLMAEEMGHLYDSFTQSHPDRTTGGSRYY